MYLNEPAVERVLEFVARHAAAGSEIVFDYVLARILTGSGPEPPGTRAARTERLAAYGEPWLFGIPEGGTRAMVEGAGLDLASDAGVADLFPKYMGRELPAGIPRPFAASFRLAVARVR